MRSDIEFRHNKPPTIHPEYEIIKWNDGDHCYTVAIFEYDAKNQYYNLRTIGDRIAGLDGAGLMKAINEGFDYLENKNKGWIVDSDIPSQTTCSTCNKTFGLSEYGRKEFIYCPNCGAKNGE